jgi:hypothetical protein
MSMMCVCVTGESGFLLFVFTGRGGQGREEGMKDDKKKNVTLFMMIKKNYQHANKHKVHARIAKASKRER